MLGLRVCDVGGGIIAAIITSDRHHFLKVCTLDPSRVGFVLR